MFNFIYPFILVYMCAHSRVCTHTCVGARGQSQISLLKGHRTSFLRHTLSSAWCSPIRLSSEPQECPRLHLLSTGAGGTSVCYHTQPFYTSTLPSEPSPQLQACSYLKSIGIQNIENILQAQVKHCFFLYSADSGII